VVVPGLAVVAPIIDAREMGGGEDIARTLSHTVRSNRLLAVTGGLASKRDVAADARLQ